MLDMRRMKDAVRSIDERADTLLGVRIDRAWKAQALQRNSFQELVVEIKEEAERCLREPFQPMTYAQFQQLLPTGQYDIIPLYGESRRRLFGLAMAAMLYESETYVRALEEMIWHICNEYTWCLPYHLPRDAEALKSAAVPPQQTVDLFAADTAVALAETVYLMADRLSPWIVHRIKEEVDRRVFQPLLESEQRFAWQSANNNWAAVCGAGVGMAALLLETDKEKLGSLLEKAMLAMESFLGAYGDDGGCAEGYHYWYYGFGHYVYFADMLLEYTNGAVNLFDHPKLSAIAAFPIGISLTYPAFVPFSDYAFDEEPAPAIPIRLHTRLGSPLIELRKVSSMHKSPFYRWIGLSRILYWSDERYFNRKPPDGTYMYPDLAWVVSRTHVEGKQLTFAAKGGHNAEPHNHNDLGQFLIHLDGHSLLTDIGAGVYDENYFGPKRYSYLHPSSGGHSVPVINGYEQKAGRHCEAGVVRWQTGERSVTFELDITSAYPAEAGLQRYIRSFEWQWQTAELRASLCVTDTFEFIADVGNIAQAFISLHAPDLSTSGCVVWQAEGSRVLLTYPADDYIGAVEAIATCNHKSDPVTVYRTTLSTRQSSRRIVSVLHFDCRVQ